jgi:hypothetical protein
MINIQSLNYSYNKSSHEVVKGALIFGIIGFGVGYYLGVQAQPNQGTIVHFSPMFFAIDGALTGGGIGALMGLIIHKHRQNINSVN